MFFSPTLFRYIGRQFFFNFLCLLLGLLVVVYLFDTVELMRRGSKNDVPLDIVFRMSLMKLPEVGQMILPFAILFSGIFTFWRLTRTNELIVVRAAGLSVWQFLTPVFLGAVFIGVFATTVVNPVSAALLTRYEQMEIKHLQKKDSLLTISKTGIWLRQHEDDGYSLIHANALDPDSWHMKDVLIFYFDAADNPTHRIEAEQARLEDGFWQLKDATLFRESLVGEKVELYMIPTPLTAQEIEDSFASPETLPFWRLPEFIRTMEQTGFSATRMRVHFQSLLAQPFLFAAMVLLAAAVSLRPPRQGGAPFMVVLGVGIGFFIFFMESILHAFGVSQKIPPYLAAWTPASVSLLLGLTALLQLEDG